MKNNTFDRRDFLKKTSILALGTGGLLTLPLSVMAITQTMQMGINIVGPKEGFSPQVGTLVSMMN